MYVHEYDYLPKLGKNYKKINTSILTRLTGVAGCWLIWVERGGEKEGRKKKKRERERKDSLKKRSGAFVYKEKCKEF